MKSSSLYASAIYLLLAIALFPGLFIDEVLHPGAVINDWIPFQPYAGTEDWSEHISDIHDDAWRMFIPNQHYQLEAARQGRFPTWNPHIYLGTPFHGNGLSAMLHPFHWPHFWFDPDSVRGPLAILRLWFAATTMYLFASRLGVGAWGGFLAGLTWMLCAFNTRWLLSVVGNSTIWLPTLLLSFDSLVTQPSLARLGCAGLAATVLQLTGHPEQQYLIGILAGSFVLIRVGSFEMNWRARLVRLVLSLAAMLLGLAGAAAALVPFLYNLAESHDWHAATHAWSAGLDPALLALFLVPDLLGRPRGRFVYQGALNYNETGGWFGLAPLMLALAVLLCLWPVWGASTRPTRATILWCACMFLGCLAIVFGVPPAVDLVLLTPMLDQCILARLLFVVQFAGAILAGIGLNVLVRASPRSLALTVSILSVVVVLVVFLFCLVRLADLPHHSLRGRLHSPSLRIHLGPVAALGFAGLLLLRACRIRHPAGPAWTTAFVALATLDLMWAAWDFNGTCPRPLANPAPPPILEEVWSEAAGGRFVAVSEILSPNLAMRYGLFDVRGYDNPQSQRLVQLIQRLRLEREITRIGHDRVHPNLDPLLAVFFNRTGVRCLYSNRRQQALTFATSKGAEFQDWPLVITRRSGDAIYRNPNVYPRAWMPIRYRATDAASALDALLDPSVDLRDLSVVEPGAAENGQPRDEPARGVVHLVRDEPEEVTLKVESPTGGLVVLADRLEPGWQVSVSGVPTSTLRTNFLFRGVLVPPGDHVVVWTYRCPGLRLGIALSLGSTAIMLILIGSSRPWRSRHRIG